MHQSIVLLLMCFFLMKANAQNDSVAAEVYVINGFEITGNKVTKDRIILREITFQVGDTLDAVRLTEAITNSRNNLRNTSLFNFVSISQLQLTDTLVLIYVNVTERWYTWPFPIFSLAETNFNTWWKNREFNRINYGMDITRYNFRGRNEKLRLKLQLGFTEQIALQYRVPQFNKKQTVGFNVGFSYSRNHEVNYISKNNDREFYKDSDKYIRQLYGAGISFTFRRAYFERHSVSMNFNHLFVSDTVVEINPNYLKGGKNVNDFITLSYSFVKDKRNNKNYALKGYYLSAGATKKGLGLLNSGIDLLDLHLGYRKYWQVGKRWYTAGSVQTWMAVNDDQPYALQNGLGYGDKSTIRSYEFYVIDGQQMGIAKAQLRYELLKPKSMEVPFLPAEKFKKFHLSLYLGVFTDVGYVNDNNIIPENRLANELQYGSGVSFDIVTYYDLVWRSEYSINKFGEHGFFLHFVAPI